MSGPVRLLGGRYQAGEPLGSGGMGQVRRGRDLRLGRDVAIKLLRSDLARDPTFKERFRREAQNAAALNHPAIVVVYDTGEELADARTAIPFIVMEFINGLTLKQVLDEEQQISPRRALEITADVCAALEFSHRHGIIHRDIKPSNVMMTQSGAIKVTDFGIARALASGASAMTQTSAVLGSAAYLSPEQARGEAVDSRTDVYAVGCTLFELVCGQPPFVGDSAVDVAYQHVREDPPAPGELNPDVPMAIDAIVLKALAKNPLNRYQSAGEMRADLLRAVAGRPILAQVPRRAAAMRIPGGRRRYTSFAAGLRQTTTMTVWRFLTMNRMERNGQVINHEASTVAGWRPPTARDLEISMYPVGADGRGCLVLLRGSEGELQREMRFPDLASTLSRLAVALENSRIEPTLSTSQDEQAARDLGTALFDNMFLGEATDLYRRCHAAARTAGSLLRLVLKIKSPTLAALPWELLFDSDVGAFLALHHPIVRYVEMALPVSGIAARAPLYVLGMVAAPNDCAALATEVERAAVESALRDMSEAGLTRLSWVNGQTWQDFQRKLFKRQYHVVHFIGHGGFDRDRGEGYVNFADRSGAADRVHASDFGAIIAGQHSLRLAVINSCESARGDAALGYASFAEALVRRGVHAVLSMQNLVSDPAAQVFSAAFFDAVAAGVSLDVAAMMARLAVRREGRGSLEWSVPVMHMRATGALLID